MVTQISTSLKLWYQINKRDLPWRNTTDPYIIWISEIILQQTRVVQGLPYFYKFIERFPNVLSLASAGEEEVLRCWQGLGYYSRARNMHATARIVMEKFDGKFPVDFHQLLTLKGIGYYTAAAIASFSNNENVAVLDGNVMRVLTRLFDIHSDISLNKTQSELQAVADRLLPAKASAIHNQAMMELGALQCVPSNPDCGVCPLNTYCIAYQNKTQYLLPIKSKKIKSRVRYFHYIVFVTDKNQYFMKQRTKGDIWQGLYDFYAFESAEKPEDSPIDLLARLKEILADQDIIINSAIDNVKHVLTHQIIYAKFIVVRIKKLPDIFINQNNLLILSWEQVLQVPKPILINNFLTEMYNQKLFN